MEAQRCGVVGCTRPVQAVGLCSMHYQRQWKHGSTEQRRPADWGSKERHPLYKTWLTLRRNRRKDVVPEWCDDFWAFANEVQTRPDGKRAHLERKDPEQPLGPGNWYWREPLLSQDERDSKSEYMRKWHRAMRARNSDYTRALELRRRYGVTIEWYDAKLEAQGNVCAICGCKETSVIRGKVLRLAVDHDHDTGKVRGLLCADCNRAIGAMRHDTQRLRSAIAYLELHQET